MARKYHQGTFTPKNPQKYKGDVHRICFRSSWENKIMRRLDEHPEVVQWASEEPWFCVPYRCPVTSGNPIRRYFPDFWVKKQKADGTFEITVIEVKPYKETQPPKTKSGRGGLSKASQYAVITWAVNQAKWSAAGKYCAAKGWKFQIMTEKDIGE